MIYFIQQGDTGPIKIGYSINPKNRIRELQTATPNKLNLLGVIKGDTSKESSLHKLFDADRLQGEWFTASEELINYVLSTTFELIEELDATKDIDIDNILIDMEKRIIKTYFLRHGKNQTKTAKALNITVRSVRHRIKKYNIETN